MSNRNRKGGVLGGVNVDVDDLRAGLRKLAKERSKLGSLRHWRDIVGVAFVEIEEVLARHTALEVVTFLGARYQMEPMSVATLDDYMRKERVRRQQARANGEDVEYRPQTRRRQTGEVAAVEPAPAPVARRPAKAVNVDTKAAVEPAAPVVEAPMAAPAHFATTAAVTPRKPARALADDENRVPVRPIPRDLEDV